jgi:prepilin-type N-terminal cleavage/methylation domain-containing protein
VTRLSAQRGYTLIEMLATLLILGTVIGGLTTLFVSGSNAEIDMSNRFDSQQQARLALDKLRREAHCASDVSSWSATSVTLSLGSWCPTGPGSISWCTVSLGSQRYGLYRKKAATCDATGTRYADYLTSGNAFTYTAQSTSSLATLHVDFPVNRKPRVSAESYRLVDDIVLRNSTRS